MNFTPENLNKKVFAFELDDVLFKKADYDLQVYYLFAHFLEFNLGFTMASDLVPFMKKVYEEQGPKAVFDQVSKRYGIDRSLLQNLERLQVNAQLPLPLILFPEMEQLLLQLFEQKKEVALLTKGNPAEQINKVKHMDWGKVKPYTNLLKIYFIDELKFRSLDPLTFLAEDYKVSAGEIFIC